MDIELLKTFLEVRKTRNFGQAALNLFVTQAAVSARIKQLEESFGVRLFLRQRNNIQLTVEGERLVPHAETMMLAWSRAKQDVELKPEQKSLLSIGSTAGLWNYAYQHKVAELLLTSPDFQLRTEVHTSAELVRLVLERALDMAILFDAPSLPELTTRPLEKLKLALASNMETVTAKSAVQANYIYVDWGTAYNIFHAKRYPEMAPPIHHTTLATIAEAMLEKIKASAYLPKSIINTSQVAGLREVEGAPVFSRQISVIYRSNHENHDSLLGISALLAS